MFDRTLLDGLDLATRVEIEENITRKDFTQIELAAIQEMLLKFFRERYPQGRPSADRKGAALAAVSEERVDDLVGRMFGESGDIVARRRAVYEAAQQDPEAREILQEMDRSGNVSKAYQAVRRLQKGKQQGDKTKEEFIPISSIGISRLTVGQHRILQEALGVVGGDDKAAALAEICAYYVDHQG